MRLFAAVAVVSMAIAPLVAACGGDDDDEEQAENTGSLEEYYRNLEAAISDAANRFVAVEPIEADEGSSDADLKETAERFFDQLVEVFEGFQRDLEEIEAPEEVARLHNESVEGTQRYLDLAGDYQERAAQAETLEETFGLIIEFSASSFGIVSGFDDSCLQLQQIADDNSIDVDLQCATEESQ